MPNWPPLQNDGTPVACALCGSNETTSLIVKMGYSISRCVRCGLVYANPRPPRVLTLNRYSRQYFWNEYLPSLGIVEGRFDLDFFDVRFKPLLDTMAARSPGKRLLEIGCGAGFFLKAAERAGWQVEGIELSEAAAQFAGERLHLRVLSEPAEIAPIDPGSFHAVAMFEVIEHLFEPPAVLAAAARALAPGGTLTLSTPNFSALSRFALGPDWAVLNPIEHLYYFTEESLTRMLGAAGFSRVEFDRHHIAWGPRDTVNFRHSHEPESWRARLTGAVVSRGAMRLAKLVQRAGMQDILLCTATKAS
jgi:SAM-dependent methyltransferase